MTDKPTRFRWTMGVGGWIRVDDDDFPGPMYVRLREDRGRWYLSEIYVDGRGNELTGAHIRGLAFLATLPAHIAATPQDREDLTMWRQGGPPLSTLASYFGQRILGAPGSGWVLDALQNNPAVPPAPDPSYPAEWDDGEPPAPRPTGELSDAFLESVARYYRWAVGTRQRPAVAIANASGVSHRTAQNWIYIARKRGILPPTRAGKVS